MATTTTNKQQEQAEQTNFAQSFYRLFNNAMSKK